MKSSTDRLAEQLRALPLEEPQPAMITARVLASARVRAVRRVPRLAIAAAILVAVLPVSWGLLYFSPATVVALADASGPGGFSSKILDDVGLGAGSNVTAQSSSATSSGYQVRLVGVYADSIRTVILLKVTPGALMTGSPRLTDQFGTTYEMHGAEGNLENGDMAAIFAPASVLAGLTGMRFTLELSQLTTISAQSVPGAWTLKGVVLVNGAEQLPRPAPGALDAGIVTFTELRYSGRVVSVRAEVRGVSLNGVVPVAAPGSKPTPRFDIQLASVNGSVAQGLDSGWSSFGEVTQLRATWVNVDPGTYVLTLSLAGGGTLQRTLLVS